MYLFSSLITLGSGFGYEEFGDDEDNPWEEEPQESGKVVVRSYFPEAWLWEERKAEYVMVCNCVQIN